jgi:hypothetical protein
MKFIKPFYGCRDGEIYPEHFAVGDECPSELEAAAIETGVVEVKTLVPVVQPVDPVAEPEPEPEPAAEEAPKPKAKKAEK